mmetsp:Transcript_27538/g.59829  ORF Transcript_27538/g.59829 Transcript_27538/m.59829 type:complete len:522 (-) Transcript_27538:53-1618(-)
MMESTPSSSSSSSRLSPHLHDSPSLANNKATIKNQKDTFPSSTCTKGNGDRGGGDDEQRDDSSSNEACTSSLTRHVSHDASLTTTIASNQSDDVDIADGAEATADATAIQNHRLSAQVHRLSSQLVEANNEIITLRKRHDIILQQSQSTESEFRRAVIRFESLLNEANGKIDTRDGTIRVLEKVVNGLREKVEQLQRELNGRSRSGGGNSGSSNRGRRSSSRSNVSDSSIIGASATKTPRTSSSKKSAARGSGTTNTGFSSMLSPFKSPPSKPVGSSSPFAVARSPDRTPPRNGRPTTQSAVAAQATSSASASSRTPPRSTSRKNKVSGSFYRTPPPSSSGKTSTSVRAMNLAPVHLTPSSKAAFLLQEQKKTIESLTCTLIGERDRNAVLEGEIEELRRTLEQYTTGSGSIFLSPSLVQREERVHGNVDGDGDAASCGSNDSGHCLDSCDSDDFDYCERSIDSHNHDGDIGRPDGFGLYASQGGDGIDEEFIRKLDELGIDLSTEIANLSTACGGDVNVD